MCGLLLPYVELLLVEARGSAADDEVSDVILRKALRPVHEVHKFDAPPGRDAEASRRCDALRALTRALLAREAAARARIPGRLAGGELRPARHFQLERRAEAGVDGLRAFQPVEETCIQPRALGRTVRAALIFPVRAGGRIDTEPAQARAEGRGVRLLAALGVRVLDTQQQAPASAPCEQEVK